MQDSISIIGGADGPTSITLGGQLGMNWLNIFGLIFVVLLLIPNIIYAIKFKDQQNMCTIKFMNILEQIGRYGCMFFMIFNIGILEFGFVSAVSFFIYLVGNILLLTAYWIFWLLYFKKQTFGKQMALAIIPLLIFILSGTTMRHVLLNVFGSIFGVGHIFVTAQNSIKRTSRNSE